MSDDVSTAYICIYCPFNSDNLQSLEFHLTSVHGCGNSDAQQSPLNCTTKATKREVPDDEQSSSFPDGTEQNSVGIKRLKGASSTDICFNGSREHSDRDEENENENENENEKEEEEEEEEEDDQCDSSSMKTDREETFSASIGHEFPNLMNSNEKLDKTPIENSSVTKCPYCEYKTTDIEQFKSHIVAHIRDKNYRCLLCNRLYKYRGDCSFHIRRKHHRFSSNFNDYIQRFVFDTSDADESTSNQLGGQNSSNNVGSTNHLNSSRETEEPTRYFSCPYCDYTSNYGGDVRKHQTRKHPNAESKVNKILRQDSEKQLRNVEEDEDEAEEEEERPFPSQVPILTNFAPVRVFQCSSCHQQGTYKWVVERHIRAKHPDQADAHVIELPAELSVKLQKITSPLKRFRCSLCSLQSKHSWVVVRHIKHFHTLQTASVLDIQPDGKPLNFSSGDFSTKSTGQDSESSSASSSAVDLIENDEQPAQFDSMTFSYKCSICDYQSTISWEIQKHINEKHSEQSNAYVLTECRQKNESKTSKPKANSGSTRSLSPASALAKAKFSPAVEEALLSLQGSKINSHLYAVQPKFGIKRLKCRHCFYRSNWKTDMIRHVRIRHNITEPDHHKDMITMSEQEARSTIESYENTFGKELRRRTFRTWNDWAKAEQEFTPRDGSLQYVTNEKELKRSTSKIHVKKDLEENSSKLKIRNEKSILDSSNIVSRLLLTTSPLTVRTDDDAPLDLSLKTSTSEDDEDEQSSIVYFCSVCRFKSSNWSIVDQHVSLHRTGRGFSCRICSFSSENKSSMIEHFHVEHRTSQIPSDFSSPSVDFSATIVEEHRCSFCSYRSENEDSLNLHLRLEHHDDEEKYDIDTSDDDETISQRKNLFECPICSPSINGDNSLTNLELLTIHVIEHHQHHQSCPFCSFTTNNSTPQTLIQHVQLHFNGQLILPDPHLALEQVKELLIFE